jgi:hypothetical protein
VAASNKKKAPAAKPVARRFKVAVPERLTIAFDTTRATWFNETTNAQLRGWKGSEHELVARACRLSGFTPDRIVHQGAQLLAQRLIATALSDAHLTVTRGGRPRSGRRAACRGLQGPQKRRPGRRRHHRLTPGLRLHPEGQLPHGDGLAGQSRAARAGRGKGRGQRQGNRRRPGNHRTADRRAGPNRGRDARALRAA